MTTDINLVWCLIIFLLIVAIVFFLLKRKKPVSAKSKTTVNPTPVVDSKPAKTAFLENIDRFTPLLDKLFTDDYLEGWTEQIVNINNPRLTEMWSKSVRNLPTWLRIMSSWGVRQDSCKSFTYLPKNKSMYDTADKSTPVEGERYRVIRGCWILTNDTEGTKHILKKGLIEKL